MDQPNDDEPDVAREALPGEPATVAQAVVLRLYPNEAQAAQMRQWIGAARALWNHLLAVQKEVLPHIAW